MSLNQTWELLSTTLPTMNDDLVEVKGIQTVTERAKDKAIPSTIKCE